MRKIKYIQVGLVFMASMLFSCAKAQKIDTGADRAKTNLKVDYTDIGTLVPKSVKEADNDLTLGCEVLDRDYTDYDAYKEYLAPLGIKRIRLQAGWAKTEKKKGVYDFAWLDYIIDDAVSRGLSIWLETSYGNPIYEGGGTIFLAGGWPTSDEAKAAWNKWVEAMAARYKGKVHEWEIWNEPDINKSFRENKDYKDLAELNIRTASIIKKIQPEAEIAGLALAGTDAAVLGALLNEFRQQGKLELFDWISYHGYTYRPEDVYPTVEAMKDTLQKYSSRIKLWQGENGSPSKGYMGGAISQYNWSEVSQAKWALRRMLNDHGRDIRTGIFCISDMNYGGSDAIKIKNVKGLLESDDNKQIVKVKRSYYAVQNLVSIYGLLSNRISADNFSLDVDYSHTLFAYEDKATGLQSFLVWFDEATPTNFNQPTLVNIEVRNGNFKDPVWIDLLSGKVYEIPTDTWKKQGDKYLFRNIPVYDSPAMVVDRSLVKFKK